MNNARWIYENLRLSKQEVDSLSKATKTHGKVEVIFCSHVEWKLAILAKMMFDAGFLVTVIGNNPSTCDPLCIQYLSNNGVKTYDTSKVQRKELDLFLSSCKEIETAHFIFDDGGHIVTLCKKINQAICCTEFTQTGVLRIVKHNELNVPVFNLNSSFTKEVIGNLYGCGISALCGFQLATNLSIAGKRILVIGYGNVGKSVANSFRGANGSVSIFDIDQSKTTLANLDGFSIKNLKEGLKTSDIVITCTGAENVINSLNIQEALNDLIICNMGHDYKEINFVDLKENLEVDYEDANLTKFMVNSKSIFLLKNGEPINLSAGIGFPIDIIDYSFAAALKVWRHSIEVKYVPGFYEYPDNLVNEFLSLKGEKC